MKSESKFIIYTDGGIKGNGEKSNYGSWAYRMEYLNFVKEDSGIIIDTTSNRCEMTAIIQALKTLKKFNIPIILYSDSMYCVKGITEWYPEWQKINWRGKKNVDLWQELIDLKDKFKEIEFVHVRGHEGNPGNERVDEMCNIAMNNFSINGGLSK